MQSTTGLFRQKYNEIDVIEISGNYYFQKFDIYIFVILLTTFYLEHLILDDIILSIVYDADLQIESESVSVGGINRSSVRLLLQNDCVFFLYLVTKCGIDRGVH